MPELGDSSDEEEKSKEDHKTCKEDCLCNFKVATGNKKNKMKTTRRRVEVANKVTEINMITLTITHMVIT